MKKKMVVITHSLFWLCFPVIQTIRSLQLDTMPGINTSAQNPFLIVVNKIASLFGRADVGRDFNDAFNIWETIVRLSLSILLPVGIFYLYYGYFIPKAISQKNIKSKLYPVLFLLVFPYLLVTLLAFCTFSIGWNYWYHIISVYSCTLFFAVAGSIFRILENWYNVHLQNEKLKRQNLQSELALLKSQINPHFLFNSLNNIDMLIKKDSDKASECLLGLSAILRYMIYDSNAGSVLLSREIQYCHHFIKTQQIQYANCQLVSFVVGGESENIHIAPMLFIPFIENAFKHCSDKDKLNAIVISFHMIGKRIKFEATNLFDKAKIIRKDQVGGVGLHTVQRRLEILYPQQHTLSIGEKNGLFHVLLTIDTDEN